MRYKCTTLFNTPLVLDWIVKVDEKEEEEKKNTEPQNKKIFPLLLPFDLRPDFATIFRSAAR